MTAQQASAGDGFGRSHKRRTRCGCGSGDSADGSRRHGVIGRTTRGISEAFGIPRKGVLIAFILVLIFSFPVGVMLFGLAWAYVHHPDWFDGLRGKVRGAGQSTSAGRAARQNNSKPDAEDERPTVGVDYEESWMEELREQFDDLERRTGSMEGFVASGEYHTASEFKKMQDEDDAKSADDVDKKSDEPKA